MLGHLFKLLILLTDKVDVMLLRLIFFKDGEVGCEDVLLIDALVCGEFTTIVVLESHIIIYVSQGGALLT